MVNQQMIEFHIINAVVSRFVEREFSSCMEKSIIITIRHVNQYVFYWGKNIISKSILGICSMIRIVS